MAESQKPGKQVYARGTARISVCACVCVCVCVCVYVRARWGKQLARLRPHDTEGAFGVHTRNSHARGNSSHHLIQQFFGFAQDNTPLQFSTTDRRRTRGRVTRCTLTHNTPMMELHQPIQYSINAHSPLIPNHPCQKEKANSRNSRLTYHTVCLASYLVRKRVRCCSIVHYRTAVICADRDAAHSHYDGLACASIPSVRSGLQMPNSVHRKCVSS